MKWYLKLSIDQKINMKEYFVLICGIEWSSLNAMFSISERVGILYSKLVKEGIVSGY